MGKNKDKKKDKTAKKEVSKAIQEKLTGALADYRKDLGDKKFNTRIRKASKLFSRGVGKGPKKAADKVKKMPVKKVESMPEAAAQ